MRKLTLRLENEQGLSCEESIEIQPSPVFMVPQTMLVILYRIQHRLDVLEKEAEVEDKQTKEDIPNG